MVSLKLKKYIEIAELFLLCFIIFFIPLNVNSTFIPIGILVLIFFMKKENYSQLRNVFLKPKFIILILPYLFTLLGLLYTQNVREGNVQLGIASSLVAFPLIFLSFKSNSQKHKTEFIQMSMVGGILLAYIICMTNAVFNYFGTKDINVFVYQNLASALNKGPHHLSYSVLFGIIVIIGNLLGRTPLFIGKKNYLYIKIILFFLFSTFLFQLLSKISIILFITSMFIIFIYMIINKRLKKKTAIALLAVVVALIIGFAQIPAVQQRFENLITAFTSSDEQNIYKEESTALRLAAIRASKSIIKENFWLGVGTGDLFDNLQDYYKDNGYTYAYENRISPHNQFLRSFIMYGILGFISVLLIFILLGYTAIKKKHFIMLFWTFIMLFIFCVEDMLGIKNGIIFFCYYTSYFILCPDDTNYIIKSLNNINSIYK